MELIDYTKTDDYRDFIEKVKLTTKKAKDKFWMRDETLSKIDFPRNHKSVIFIRSNDYGTGFYRTSYDPNILGKIMKRQEYLNVIDKINLLISK